MKTTSNDDTVKDTDDDLMDDYVRIILTDTFEAIVAEPDLALEVIDQIALLTRSRNDNEPKDIEDRREILGDIVDVVIEAMYEHRQKGMAKEVADISALHQLGRFMLSEFDNVGDEEEGLYALISVIVGSLAESLAELGKLTWTFGITDKVLIEMAADDGVPPEHAPGELDRARSTMRDAGWLSWEVEGDCFHYTLTPPENWRELVKDNEAAIAVAEREAQGGALQ